MNYRLSDDMTGVEAAYIQQQLIAFSDRYTEPRNYRELGLVLRDEAGTVVGGVTANAVWDWLQIGALWVADEVRGQGFGHQLLEGIERSARDQGCRFAKLTTFEFQAREFYESHGYVVRWVFAGLSSGPYAVLHGEDALIFATRSCF